jgi:cyclic pyranopterin phosphate synthase
MRAEIKDIYGRKFKTLRVSLLRHCNLGCVYCVSGEEELRDTDVKVAENVPDADGLLAMVRSLHGHLGLQTVRLTGGEPLLYPGLARLIQGIRDSGIPRVKLTTNGFLLERQALLLKEAGLDAMNVSLDAVDEDVFYKISRRHSAARIIKGIDAAIMARLDVKINMVVMRGINDSQILPMLDLAFSRGLRIRFLEVMAMGHLYHQAGNYLFTQEDILRVISGRHELRALPRTESATARYWATEDGHVFGIIANESEPFCKDCDRLRLDSSGKIYGCLSNNKPIGLDLLEDEEEWANKLAEALAQKQPLRFTGSELSMIDIGG